VHLDTVLKLLQDKAPTEHHARRKED
jgi:hypothetical protein